jgi:hypothetical protein
LILALVALALASTEEARKKLYEAFNEKSR